MRIYALIFDSMLIFKFQKVFSPPVILRIAEAKQKNMFVSGRLMIWNRVGRSDFNFFLLIFFLKKYNAVKCKIECYIYDFK